MVIGRNASSQRNASIELPGLGIIPHVESYRHLGLLKSAYTRSFSVKDRLKLAWAAFHCLKLLWSNGLHVLLRLRIFNALVSSVLSYGAAALVLTQKELKEVDTEVNKMRRLATGVPLWDGQKGTPNSALYRGDPKFSTVIRENRARLVGHMLRHDTPFANVMLWSTKENARIKSLSEACAEDLGMDVAELGELAQDREAWRAVVGNFFFFRTWRKSLPQPPRPPPGVQPAGFSWSSELATFQWQDEWVFPPTHLRGDTPLQGSARLAYQSFVESRIA